MADPLGCSPSSEIADVLGAWPAIRAPHVTRIAVGLIHRSFRVRDRDQEYVLQRVNPIFSPRIHDNIQAVTEHLHAKGIPTLRLLPTRTGRSYLDLAERGVWRLMTRVPGASFEVCASAAQAHAAAALVARFHTALDDLDYTFHATGIPSHDTAAHLSALETALVTHRAHRLYEQVAPLADRILRAARGWAPLDALPARVTHGDLKFNNVLFAENSSPARPEALSLIDLDTVSRLPLCLELGDAWRSWCNRSGEDCAEAQLDLELFGASLAGYLGALRIELGAMERASLVDGLERISLELAARFAADALCESYFGWDPARFASLADHNWTRALGQYSLYEQARQSRDERARLLLG